MDADLQDLLVIWQGGEEDLAPERCAALLARLHDDEAFRRLFVEEIRLLGMLKVVQAPEPRWLRLEDELGWSRQEHVTPESLADRVMKSVRDRQRRRRVGWALAVAALLALAIGIALHRSIPTPEALRAEETPALPQLATVAHLDKVQWPSPQTRREEGSGVTAGPLRLRSGQLTLAFLNGVTLTVVGPANLELRSCERIFFRQGQLRAQVPPGAEGFTVLVPGCEMVGLGADFGLHRIPNGKVYLRVYEGEVALSFLGAEGRSIRGALLKGPKVVEVDPAAARIKDEVAAVAAESFIPPPTLAPPVLDLAPDYAAEVLASKPWGYWRFEKLAEGLVANEVAGRPPLRAAGGIQLASAPGGANHWAVFQPRDMRQILLMDGEWSPPRARGYALELWVQPTLSGPDLSVNGATTLLALAGQSDGPPEKHAAILELAARSRRSLYEPCLVRFLDRWPAGEGGGDNVFSPSTFVPAFWHHLVAQKAGALLELYIDGQLAGTSPATGQEDEKSGPCHLLVGRLKREGRYPPQGDWLRPIDHLRPFEGHLDELAVYDRPLTPEEIQRHFQGRVLQGQKMP